MTEAIIVVVVIRVVFVVFQFRSGLGMVTLARNFARESRIFCKAEKKVEKINISQQFVALYIVG